MPPDDSPAGACPSCGKIFCIACRKDQLQDSRFTCPDCGEGLKLSDNRLRYLVRLHLQRDAEANWWAAERPDVWSRAHKLLLVSGLINWKLTGRFVDYDALALRNVRTFEGW